MHAIPGVDEWIAARDAGCMVSTLSLSPFATANDSFDGGRGYLAACTVGLPTRATRAAVIADLEAASRGMIDIRPTARPWSDRARLFARLVGTSTRPRGDRLAGLGVLGAHRDGCARRRRGARARGRLLVDRDAVRARGARHPRAHCSAARARRRDRPADIRSSRSRSCSPRRERSRMPRRSSRPRAGTAPARSAMRHRRSAGCRSRPPGSMLWSCHAYKWLCAPRGVAFLAIGEELQSSIMPPVRRLVRGGRPVGVVLRRRVRARVRRAPLRCVARVAGVRRRRAGARAFASLDADAVLAHTTGLATRFRERMGLGLPERPSAIVTWADPDGTDLARLGAAGITASGRSGRARVAFHVFNDGEDVDLAVAALGR